MKIKIMRTQTSFILFLAFIVIALAIAFYFWELYLLRHYLGGYDSYHLPIQQSHTGFSFFITSWPLWLFPVVLTSTVLIISFQRAKLRQKHKMASLKDELHGLKEKYNALLAKEHAMKNKLTKVKGYTHLQNKHRKLEEEYLALKKDYNRSLDFAEKLLENIKETEQKDSL